MQKHNLDLEVVNQEQYLKEFDVVKNYGCVHKQTWEKANVKKIG